MRRFIFILLSLGLTVNVHAGTITRHTTYATNSEVTATNLNGNLDNIVNECNGGLDNTNMDTVSGYRLFEIVGALPVVGTQGRVAYLTTNNTLNFDTGSAWNQAITASGTPSQGDILYYNGTAWTRLAAGTSGQFLKTQGASANPTWTNPNADTLDTYDSSTSAGVNKIYVSGADNYLPDNTVDTTALKTSTGEVSTTDNNYTVYTLPGGEYGFYPQFKKADNGGSCEALFKKDNQGSVGTSYATLITLYNGTGSAIYARQRYVTASGTDLWIFLLLDKSTGKVISAYQAPDHPAYGNGGDFEKVPHPFNSYDETKHEIINVDKETCSILKAESKGSGKSILTLVNDEYKPDLNTEKEYKPLHSGKYLGEKPELVMSIPSYIKVRRLVKK